MIGGKPCCPACGNALRPKVTCVACGRPSLRPNRSAEHGGLICEPCARKSTHATCRTCRKHRPIARRDGQGRPLCRGCAAEVPVTRVCPTCGKATPGAGAARCPACELAGRVQHAVEAGSSTLRQAWVRDLFIAFCDWDGLRRARGDMPRHIAKYASFFAVIDRACSNASEVTQARLVELYGAEGLRRGFQAVAFLAARLALPWDYDDVAAANERRRVADLMAIARAKPWAGDLKAYGEYLEAGPALAPITKRMYVSAAAALLQSSGVQAAAELTQSHLLRHLRRSPGRRTNLLRFLSWTAGRSGQGFQAGPMRRTSPRKLEKATLRRATALLNRLAVARNPRERRAALAAAIAVTHGMPLKKVLAFRRNQHGHAAIELAEPFATAIHSMNEGQTGLVFLGRNGIQPLSTSAVRYHVRPPRQPN